jgi:urease accessory protein
MLRCSEVRPAGTWNDASAADGVILDFDGRHRRRVVMATQAGLAFLLDLPRALALRNGDGLVLDDGRIVRVTARSEPLLEIAAPNADALIRIAWHLGNRHLPMQLREGRLYIRHDHVILEMIRGLTGHATAVEAPFDPEAGAFAHAQRHGDAHIHR